MLLMLDTSQPYGPLGQSPIGEIFMHASTALLSSALDCGENAGVQRSGVGGGVVGQGRNSRAEF